MSTHESIGYVASLLVLATFCMGDMRALRLLAIASNFAFIAYGALAGIGPVLLLHLVLLPVNLVRLVQTLQRGRRKSRHCRNLPSRSDASHAPHRSSPSQCPTHQRTIRRSARSLFPTSTSRCRPS